MFLSGTWNISRKLNSQSDVGYILPEDTVKGFFLDLFHWFGVGVFLVEVLLGLFVYFLKYNLKLTSRQIQEQSIHLSYCFNVHTTSHKPINTPPRTRKNDSKALEKAFFTTDVSSLPGYNAHSLGGGQTFTCIATGKSVCASGGKNTSTAFLTNG